MCGRFSLSTSKEKIKAQIEVNIDADLSLSFNIAPTQKAYVIANDLPNQLQQMYWGLVPHWSRTGELSGSLINARKEGISSKPSFRMPLRQRRCLVPADSFYEWKKEGGRKIPYRILPKDKSLLFFAAIWDIWTDGNHILKTFSIITTPPNAEMRSVHNRMPVILDTPEKRKVWLLAKDLNAQLAILRTLDDELLDIYRVSEKVNSPKHNIPELHEVVPEPPMLF